MFSKVFDYLKSLINRNVFKNFSWMFLVQVINIIGSFFVSVLAARFFGAEKYGAYNYSLAFVSVCAPLYLWGIESYAIKEFAQNKEDVEKTFGTIYYGLLFLAVVVSSILIGVSFLLGLDLYKKIFVILIVIPYLFNPCLTAKYFLMGKKQIKLLSLSQMVIQILFLGAKISFLVYTRSIIIFAIINSLESMAQLIVNSLVLKREKNHVKAIFDFEKLKKIFKVCAPLLGSSITVSVYMRADQLMIGNMIGDAELGVYSVAVKLSEFWYVVPATMYSAVLPILSKDLYNNKKAFWKKFQDFSDILCVVSYGAVLGVALLGEVVINNIYGPEYANAANIMKIYILGGIGVGIGHALSAYVNINEDSIFSFINTLFGCVLNLLLNACFIPRYGSCGAAMATIAASLSNTFLICFCYGLKNEDYRKIFICQTKSLFPFCRLIKKIV